MPSQPDPVGLPFLRLALRLAARGRYRTSPNPMVGAVVVREGEVVGKGYHRQAGEPHAEVEALRVAGERSRGATLYVTLEPCAHHGRTPPCVEAILAAGIRRVVACHLDPDPRVAGKGLEALRQAGVDVEWGHLTREAVLLNWSYLASTLFGRPAVTLKWAMSLDGRIATHTGQSQWISSPEGRRWALLLREEHDVVLVGIGTVLADDPRLNRRLGRAPGPNFRVILDRQLRLSPAARLFQEEGPVLVYTRSEDRTRSRALEEKGATVIRLEEVAPGEILADLHRRGLRSVLVEGGSGILGSFVEKRLFDRVAIGCAPLLIGGAAAPGPVAGEGAPSLAEAFGMEELRARRRGPDLILTAFRKGCLPALFRSVGAS